MHRLLWPIGVATILSFSCTPKPSKENIRSDDFPTGEDKFGLVQNTPAAKAARQQPESNAKGTRYIVQFANAQGRQALEAAGGYVALALPRQNAVAAFLPEKAVKALQNNPAIALIEEDQKRFPFAEVTPYGISLVQANQLSDALSGDVTLCIIDSGYQDAHPDLQSANVTTSPDIGSGDPLNDGCGHGTHVAGTAAALANGDGVVGINPSGNVNLHIVKVFGNDCAWAYSSTLVKALGECQANATGKLVVSMSLGGTFKSRTEDRAFAQAEADGVLSIAAAGNDGNTRKSYPASYDSVMSVAAVDENLQHASFSQSNSAVEIAAPGVGVLSTVPWADENSVTVNGIKTSGNHVEFAKLATVTGNLADGGECTSVGSWTNQIVLCKRGTVSFLDKVTNAQQGGAVGVVIFNNEPGPLLATLGAGNSSNIPAIGIAQTDGETLLPSVGQSATVVSIFDETGFGYAAWNGTSMATPHVSGVAALVWGNYPAATNAQIRSALTESAADLGAAGRDDAFGHGLVQAKAALDLLQNGPQCTATEPTEISCGDGIDNDCDGLTDAADSDCDTGGSDGGDGGGGSCDLAQVGEACTIDSDCCSSKCKGREGAKTCK